MHIYAVKHQWFMCRRKLCWLIKSGGVALLLAVALGWANAEAQITDIYSQNVQNDINSPQDTGWVDGPSGWTYTVLDTDGDPNDPDEASEGEGYTVGPFSTPDSAAAGIIPQSGDFGAADAQPFNTAADPTSGGPVDLATGSETVNQTVLALSGARELDFTISYNSQLTAGNMYVSNPSGGASPYWTLYTPGDLGHWTHNYDGQAAYFPGTGGAASLVIIQISHRRWTFVQHGTSYQTFDQSSAYDSLVKTAGGGYILTTRDQSTYTFSGSGLYLTKTTNRHGQAINIARNASGQITTITEPVSGKYFALTYGTAGNSAGRVTTITDSAGRSVSLNYDSNSLLTQITEANGGTTSFTYDSLRHLLTEADAQGNVLTSNSYDLGTADTTGGLGYVTAQQDARGNIYGYGYATAGDYYSTGSTTTYVTNRDGTLATYVFDQNHNLTSFISPNNETTTYSYDTNGNLLAKSDPLGNTTLYGYDNNGNCILITDPLYQYTVMTYDNRHNLLTVVNPDNDTSTFTYDANNNLLTATDSLGHKVTRTYDANSLLLTQTNPNGGVSVNTYTNGLLVRRKDAAGNTESMTYDAVGNLATLRDPTGATTTYHYGPLRELLEVDDAAGNKVVNTYDWRLRKTTVTDPSGAVTAFAYDGNNNIVATTNALQQVTIFAYDLEDRPIAVTDPLGNTSSRYYDADGRLTNSVDAAGDSISYTYDGANNLLSVVDGLGNQVVLNTYDARNQLIASTDALGRTSNLTYDNARLLASRQDPLGLVNSFVHDALGRTTTVNAPLSTATGQTFDADGNRIAITNANDKATSFTFDTADRLAKTTTATGKATTYGYNTRSLPSAISLPSGSSTTLTYDSLGRVSTAVDPVGTITYTYDNNGRVISTAQTISGTTKTISRQYDLLGRLTQFTDAAGNVLKYTYDAAGNLTTLTYPDGKQVAYGYDAARRLTSVTDWAGRGTQYAYDNDGRVTTISRPDQSTETFTYDAAGEILQSYDTTTSQNIIHQINYAYDGDGETTNEDITPAPGIYHPANLAFTLDADNRLATINQQPAVYDSNGNLTGAIIPGSPISRLTYDARNRLLTAGGLSYTYDAENRRISVTSPAGVTSYVIDPNAGLNQILVKTAPNGTVTRYVYGLGLIGEETGTNFTTYHYDHRGSTTALTDINGNILNTFSYGPNGEPVGFNPATAPTQFLYGGRYGVVTDTNGLCFMRARYYLPVLSRFINQDVTLGSIESGLSLNRYAYANGDPIDKNDPFGLAAQPLDYGQAASQFGQGLWDSLKNAAIGTFDLGVNVLGTDAYGLTSLFDQSVADQYFGAQVQGLENTVNGIGTLGSQIANGDFADVATELTGGAGQSGAYRLGSAAGSVGLILGGGILGEVGTVGDAGAVGEAGAAAETASFFDGAAYSSKVLQQMEGGVGEFHSFPEAVVAFEDSGTVKTITGGDGQTYQMLEIPGSYQSAGGTWYSGSFQFIKDSNGVINHRLFVPSQ